MLTHEKKNGNVSMSVGCRLGECRNGNGCGRRTAMHGKLKTKSTLYLYAREKKMPRKTQNKKQQTLKSENPNERVKMKKKLK